MALLSKKNERAREQDDRINTPSEMIDSSEDKLWESDPMKALVFEGTERRKKLNWWARFLLSIIIVLTFLFLVWLLFMEELPQASRDLINIMVGAYVAVLAKSTDYWFKDKDDPEHRETQSHLENGNNNEDN
tara:strand:- start:11692 stop:12087 length:396 start_codon:yes stop_codon:yes gene_type:complete